MRGRLLLGIIVLVSGCAVASASPTDTSSPSPANGSEALFVACTVPPPDYASVYRSLQEVDPVVCHGRRELAFDAWWTGGPGGVVDCPPIEPSWFSCESLILIEPPRAAAAIVLTATTPPGQMQLWVVLQPEANVTGEQMWQGNASIIGHFDDPAALECEWANAGPAQPDFEAVRACRRTFVVTVLEGIQ